MLCGILAEAERYVQKGGVILIDLISVLISTGGSVLVGVFSLIGVMIAGNRSNREITQKIAVAQAVTDTKIAELTREVHEHNCFARRVPVVEEQIRFFDHRIEELEQQTKGGYQS